MASLTFNDGSARTLTNSVPAPGNQLRGWQPIPTFIGAKRIALAGLPHAYRRRTAWRISASIENLLPSELDIAQRAIVHLDNAGTVTVNTADIAARTHTCYMAAGDSASISPPNDEGKFTFSFTLSIYPAPATPPLCIYYTS